MAKMQDNSKAVFEEVKRLTKQKMTQAALIVERKAKQNCPVKTGTLKRSITHVVNEDGTKAVVGSNVEYCPHVELGTSKMSAQPFLRPALESSKSEIRTLFGAK